MFHYKTHQTFCLLLRNLPGPGLRVRKRLESARAGPSLRGKICIHGDTSTTNLTVGVLRMFWTRNVHPAASESHPNRRVVWICVGSAVLLVCSLCLRLDSRENEKALELESDEPKHSDELSKSARRHPSLQHSSGDAFRAWHQGNPNVLSNHVNQQNCPW